MTERTRKTLLTELDIVRGAESYAIPCDACNGRGFIQESEDAYILCTKCGGDCRLLVTPAPHISGTELLLFLLKVLAIAGAVGAFVYWWFRLPF